MVIVNIKLFLNNSALRLRSCNDEKSETVVGPTNQLCAKCKVIQRTHKELRRLLFTCRLFCIICFVLEQYYVLTSCRMVLDCIDTGFL